MIRILLLLILVLIPVSLFADDTADRTSQSPKTPPPFVKGREFAYRLVKGMKLDSALPKKPVETDLLAILSGDRSLLVEAEDVYDKKRDRVTMRNFNVYGRFTGLGWLNGTSEPTSVSLKTIIPRAGNYKVSASIVGKGHLLSLGGKAFKVDGGDKRFKEVKAGEVYLEPGQLNFSIVLPPDGAVDSVRIETYPLAPIEPFNGWRLPEEITYQEAAEVAVVVMGSDFKPPVDAEQKPQILTAVGNIVLPGGTTQTTSTVYGKYLGSAWIRNGFQQSEVEFPFSVASKGFYSLDVHWMGKTISGSLDGRPFIMKTNDYLDWADIGIFYLKEGNHTLKVTIPPSAGVDALRITARRSGVKDIFDTLSWKDEPSATIPRGDSERVLKDIISRYKPDRWL